MNAEIKVMVFAECFIGDIGKYKPSGRERIKEGNSIFKGASEIRKCRELWMDSRERHNSRLYCLVDNPVF